MPHRLMLCAALWSCLLFGCSAATRPPSPASSPLPLTQQHHALQFAAAADAEPDDLRIMSFNLRTPFVLDAHNHWAFRKDLVVDAIHRFTPDVLGTQECVNDQAWHLFEQLPNYGFVGAGRNDGDTSGEMCAIFFRTDKFRKISSGHFWLSETPDRIGSKGWNAMWRRMVTWVELQTLHDGRQFFVFNTHFDSNSSRARIESARLLRRQIARISRGLPTIITGDFNTGVQSPPYRILLTGETPAAFPIADTYREANPLAHADQGTRHGFSGTRQGERIDWILTTPGFDTVAAAIDHTRVGGRYPSDHFPITAVLQWDDAEWRPRITAAHGRPDTGG